MEWITTEGTQDERPLEVDAVSSPSCIYVRRNITQKTKTEDGEKKRVWSYDEAQLTPEEYKEYLAEQQREGVKKISDQNLIQMDAVAEVYEQNLELQESVYTLMDAVAELYEQTTGIANESGAE